MPVHIHSIATALPDFRYNQSDIRDKMKEQVGDSDLRRRIVHRIYAHSGIESRYSVLGDFKPDHTAELYGNADANSVGTAERNRIYEREARQLFLCTAGKLIRDNNLDPKEITHLVTISCTGFYAPGPDIDLIREAGLSPAVERYHLGFMGCYAAVSGLKLAHRICSGDNSAVVMILSTELCSLHFQAGIESDDLIAASLFGDGSAGALVSSKAPTGKALRLDGFASAVTPEGTREMAWTIGDTGFSMTLSSYIPDLLSRYLADILEPLFERIGVQAERIDEWAVHPGGRRILDKIQQSLGLPDNALNDSREILRLYGNMSSATILFLLARLLEREEIIDSQRTLFTMAFGPGLTVETALMSKINPIPVT